MALRGSRIDLVDSAGKLRIHTLRAQMPQSQTLDDLARVQPHREPYCIPSNGAVAVWREKLTVLLEAEAIETDAAGKYRLARQIDEARRKINELGERT